MFTRLVPKKSPTVLQFQLDYPLDARRQEAQSVRRKYPDRVPCVVEVRQGDPSGIKLDKKKYLVPSDVTLSQFSFVLRKRMRLTPEKAIFLMINDTMVSGSTTMMEAYSRYKDESEFLHVLISSENTFGERRFMSQHSGARSLSGTEGVFVMYKDRRFLSAFTGSRW